MLTLEERHEIEEELERYPHKQAVCIDAMMIVQRHRGWVSDEGIRDVAEFLGMSPADLDGVATFYNLIHRKPVGRHVVLACDSVACWLMGGDTVRERLCSRLGVAPGQATPDGRFTVLPIVCLGACDHAPVLMVDDDLLRDVEPEQVDEILERYR